MNHELLAAAKRIQEWHEFLDQREKNRAAGVGPFPMPIIKAREVTKAEELLANEYLKLRDIVVKLRSQPADDRCWMDDDELYEALGDDVKCDYRVGDKKAMRKNCDLFIDNRCQGGGPWVSYAELMKERDELKKQLAETKQEIAAYLKQEINAEE